MSAEESAAQPKAQAQRRKAARVTGEVGVLQSSVDLWESKTRGEPREGTCVDATKRSDGVVMAGKPDRKTEISSGASTLAAAVRRKPTGERHSESRVRENRMHGLMRGGGADGHWLPAFQSVAPRLLY
jgi:hypothetical protein